MPVHKRWFWVVGFAAAWLFDFLFWNKSIGISFFIWVIVLLAGCFLLARVEGKRPSWKSVLLSILIAGLASVSAWRDLAFARAISALLSIAGLLLLAATFLDGFWPWYRLRDYVVEIAKVIAAGFMGAVSLLTQKKNSAALEEDKKRSVGRRMLPILRGVLIALPIVAVLGVLLSSADPVFGDWMKQLFNLDKLPEYLFRFFYILLIGFFLVGVYLATVTPAKAATKPAPNERWVKPFLGWTESGIILGAVVLLFLTFIIIQVRYLFGGVANITETGYTYAEYARRGFSELIGVAVLSMILYLGLSTFTKQETRASQIGYKVLSVALLASVLIILASSFQRLRLYENAYGFSQLRTYTHIFILWLAGLILATIVLELIHRRGHFALALLTVIVGFGISLAVINVDGFIVDRNVNRAQAGSELDVQHLNTLSADSIPAMIRKYQEPALPQEIRDGLGTALACRVVTMIDPAKRPWQAFNLAYSQAYRLLQTHAPSWSAYKPYKSSFGEWFIKYDGEEISCTNSFID